VRCRARGPCARRRQPTGALGGASTTTNIARRPSERIVGEDQGLVLRVGLLGHVAGGVVLIGEVPRSGSCIVVRQPNASKVKVVALAARIDDAHLAIQQIVPCRSTCSGCPRSPGRGDVAAAVVELLRPYQPLIPRDGGFSLPLDTRVPARSQTDERDAGPAAHILIPERDVGGRGAGFLHAGSFFLARRAGVATPGVPRSPSATGCWSASIRTRLRSAARAPCEYGNPRAAPLQWRDNSGNEDHSGSTGSPGAPRRSSRSQSPTNHPRPGANVVEQRYFYQVKACLASGVCSAPSNTLLLEVR